MADSAGGTAVMDGRVSPIVSQSPSIAHSGGTERKASTSSAKECVVHDEGSAKSGKHSELKPIGIINEQNTCFLNSTFQAVSLGVEDCKTVCLTMVAQLDRSTGSAYRTFPLI
jgi:ubiquitin C-terminal hydrolase